MFSYHEDYGYKQTSEQWYQKDKEDDIYDPDGWCRSNISCAAYWYFIPITKEEYMSRKSECSTVPYTDEHRSPFYMDSNTIKIAQEFYQHKMTQMMDFKDWLKEHEKLLLFPKK